MKPYINHTIHSPTWQATRGPDPKTFAAFQTKEVTIADRCSASISLVEKNRLPELPGHWADPTTDCVGFTEIVAISAQKQSQALHL